MRLARPAWERVLLSRNSTASRLRLAAFRVRLAGDEASTAGEGASCGVEVDGDSAVGDGSRGGGAVGSSNLACDPCCGGGGGGRGFARAPHLAFRYRPQERGRRGRKYPLVVALTVLVAGYRPCCTPPQVGGGGEVQ